MKILPVSYTHLDVYKRQVVDDDPNAPTPLAVRNAIRAANARMEKSIVKLTALNDRLTEVEEIMKKVEAGMQAWIVKLQIPFAKRLSQLQMH